MAIEMRNGDWHLIEPRVLPDFIIAADRWLPKYSLEHVSKPTVRPRDLTRLGDAVDEVENLPDWRNDRYDAIVEYFCAVRARVWFELAKLDRIKKAPSRADGLRLYEERVAAFTRYQAAIERGTLREVIDARAALTFARERFKISSRKYNKARREYQPPSETFQFNGMTIRRKPRK
jgi:hypothetical protein